MFRQIVHAWMFGPRDLAEALAGIKRVGADGVDLSVSLHGAYNNLNLLNGGEAETKLGGCGLPVDVITPLYKTPELDFSHPDAGVRRTVVDFTCGCVDLARRWGADRVLVTPSYIGPDRHYHRSYEEDWSQAVESLARAAAYAEERGVQLMLEPITRYMVTLVHTVEEALGMAEEIGSAAVSVLPDAFHMNIEEPDGVIGGIARAQGRIGCFHLGDNNRKPPSYGSLDWPAILRALTDAGFDGPMSHEPVALYYDEKRVASDPEYQAVFEAQLTKSIDFLHHCMNELEI